MSKITHEQARESLLQVYIYNDIHTNEANYVLVRDYITQQEKQHNLLELYKELSKLKDDVIHLVMFGKDYEHLRVKTVKIEQQIKELENDKR